MSKTRVLSVLKMFLVPVRTSQLSGIVLFHSLYTIFFTGTSSGSDQHLKNPATTSAGEMNKKWVHEITGCQISISKALYNQTLCFFCECAYQNVLTIQQ